MRGDLGSRNIVAIHSDNHFWVGPLGCGGQSIGVKQEVVTIAVHCDLMGIGSGGVGEFGGINGFLGGPFHFAHCIPIVTGGNWVALAENRLLALDSFSMKTDAFSLVGTVTVPPPTRLPRSKVRTLFAEAVCTKPTQCG